MMGIKIPRKDTKIQKISSPPVHETLMIRHFLPSRMLRYLLVRRPSATSRIPVLFSLFPCSIPCSNSPPLHFGLCSDSTILICARLRFRSDVLLFGFISVSSDRPAKQNPSAQYNFVCCTSKGILEYSAVLCFLKGSEEALMLMLESKQNRMRLAATPSPLLSPHRSSSAAKGVETWHAMERIDVQEIKDQIVKRVGTKRARCYFSHFRNFVSLQSSKAKLDNLVVKTIGKENVKLHNQLIRAILTNAVKGKVPPQHAFNKNDPPGRPHSPCITNDDHASPSTVSNGDSLLASPRCGRIATLCNRKASPLRPRENHSTPDLLRPQQQHDTPARLLDAESNCLKPSVGQSKVLRPLSVDWSSGAQTTALCGEDSSLVKGGIEKAMPLFPFGSSLNAPGDVQFCFQNRCRKLQPQAFPVQLLQETLEDGTSMDTAELPDGHTMHMYMEQVAATQGLESVSKDSAFILNIALDAYVTRLIRSYISFIRSRNTDDSVQIATSFDRNGKEGSLLGPRLHEHMDGVVEHMKGNMTITNCPISLADFKLAMDTNPQLLGESWPLQLEKILFRMLNQ